MYGECLTLFVNCPPAVRACAPRWPTRYARATRRDVDSSKVLVVRSTNVVLPDKVAPANVIIKAGKIVEVASYENPLPSGAHVVDVGSLHVMAGSYRCYCDVHTGMSSALASYRRRRLACSRERAWPHGMGGL